MQTKNNINIREKSAYGVKWAFTTRVGRQIIQMLSYAFYARLLEPGDFGVINMAMLVTVFADIIKEFGFSFGLIQKKDLNNELTSSIFWLNCIIGVSLTVIIFLFAPIIGYFFNEPKVIDVLRVLSMIFLISSLSSVQRSLLEKKLNYKGVYLTELMAQFLGSGIGIGLAFLGTGIWSLVAQSIVYSLITTTLLWHFSQWRPLRVFNRSEVRTLFSFSANVTGFNIINFFARNADQILIGKYLGTTELGFYTLAYRVMLYPLNYISDIINRVMYPIYSKIQDDVEKFREVYIKISVAIASITFPLMFVLMVLSKEFVYVFFSTKWHPVSILLLILAPIGAVQSVLTTVGSVYLARGKSEVFFRWGLFSSAISVISFIIGLRWGIYGVAGCYAIASLLLSIPGFIIPLRFINLNFLSFLKALKMPFLYSALTAVVTYGALFVMRYFTFSHIMILIVSVCISVSLYAVLFLVFQKEFIIEIKRTFLSRLK